MNGKTKNSTAVIVSTYYFDGVIMTGDENTEADPTK